MWALARGALLPEGPLDGLDKLLRDLRFGLRSLRAEPGVRAHGDSDAGAGDWREHGGVQRDERGAAEVAAGGDPDRLVYLRTSNPPRGTGTIDTNQTFSYPVYDALRKQSRGLSPVMAYVPLSGSKVAVRYGAQPEEAEGDMVSGTFFSGLGVNLPLGRGFSDQDESEPCADRRDQLQLLDAAICARPGCAGKDALCERRADDDCGRCGAGL